MQCMLKKIESIEPKLTYGYNKKQLDAKGLNLKIELSKNVQLNQGETRRITIHTFK